MGISRSFESGIQNFRKVSTYDIMWFGTNIHKISTLNHISINIGPIISKAVTFDLESEKEKMAL